MLNELPHAAMLERYRVAVTRFDYLWYRCISNGTAEMTALLAEIEELEFRMARCDRARCCATKNLARAVKQWVT
ncbi:hypothetical protein [Caballeronia sp. GAWG2-1]|uniref:hypothetical protein n=1 Tax=Caballeronia sp. GAWG2-1 TaxID=2921744 RepID=UPI002028CD40|nr:hypothetical protein [Caballeronia sp. GAWG2-1]